MDDKGRVKMKGTEIPIIEITESNEKKELLYNPYISEPFPRNGDLLHLANIGDFEVLYYKFSNSAVFTDTVSCNAMFVKRWGA